MLRALIRGVGRLVRELIGTGRREPQESGVIPDLPPREFRPLRRLVLTDGVSRTLFEEYAQHRQSERGEEETGWLLLGLREADEAVALATLPAGAGRQAGVAHVRFNSEAQAVGSRIVRQSDRRLTILGVVHTHPGSLRHPSEGDFEGDRVWVTKLRGGAGVFGIGTADAPPADERVAQRPKPHVQCLGKLRFSWYSLSQGDEQYRPLNVDLTLGPDLARPLRPVWPVIETQAVRLDRLARQQARVTFDVVERKAGPALAVTVPLAERGEAVQVLLDGKEVCYFLIAGGEVLAADLREPRVDQGVYLLLAELAARK